MEEINIEIIDKEIIGLEVETAVGRLVSVEDYYLEGTTLYVLLSNGQTLVIDISENEDIEFTVQQIEELIVSYFETKTIKEVEN